MLAGFILLSICFHVGFVLAMSQVEWMAKPLPKRELKPFEVTVVSESAPEPPRLPLPPISPPAPPVVEQKTNKEEPEKAEAISEEANKTERDVIAKGSRFGKREAPKANPEPEPAEVAEAKPNVDIGKLFQVPLNTPSRPDSIAEKLARAKMKDNDSNHKLLADFDSRDKAFRGSLESFGSEVGVGNHTSVNAYADSTKAYIERIHRKIHRRWAEDYLLHLDTGTPMASPMRDPRLHTLLEMVLDGRTGEVEKVNIVQTSGQLQYDSEAIIILQSIGPHGPAPRDVISANGKVYVHWNFWRDSRQCGVFGASIFLVNSDG